MAWLTDCRGSGTIAPWSLLFAPKQRRRRRHHRAPHVPCSVRAGPGTGHGRATHPTCFPDGECRRIISDRSCGPGGRAAPRERAADPGTLAPQASSRCSAGLAALGRPENALKIPIFARSGPAGLRGLTGNRKGFAHPAGRAARRAISRNFQHFLRNSSKLAGPVLYGELLLRQNQNDFCVLG